MTTAQFVEPAVSRAKFDREIAQYRELEDEYRRRGWFLVVEDFPEVVVILAAPQITPPPIVMGVKFDYSNYDAAPPSVQLVNPFSLVPYKLSELPTTLKRSVENSDAALPPGLQLPPGAQATLVTHQPLMQAYGDSDVPFLCLAGVKEYHEHPGHSGDSWDLHRKTGAGRLVRLLEVLTTYGVKPLSDYQVALSTQVTGFVQRDVPT